MIHSSRPCKISKHKVFSTTLDETITLTMRFPSADPATTYPRQIHSNPSPIPYPYHWSAFHCATTTMDACRSGEPCSPRRATTGAFSDVPGHAVIGASGGVFSRSICGAIGRLQRLRWARKFGPRGRMPSQARFIPRLTRRCAFRSCERAYTAGNFVL